MRRLALALAMLLGTGSAWAGGLVTPPTPLATTSVTGKVKPDGTSITVTGDGTISTSFSGNLTNPFAYGALYSSAATTPTSAGSGYAAGNTITLNDGCATHVVLAVVTVSGSGVANWIVQNTGSCAATPANPVSQLSTSGSGSGATFTLGFGPLAADIPFSSLGGTLQNTILGNQAARPTTGNEITAYGYKSCLGVTTGSENTCLGWQAGGTWNGSFSVFVGGAGVVLTGTGNNNVVIGDVAVRNATDITNFTIVGAGGARNLTGSTASGWTGVGENVFLNNTNGNSSNNSTAIGLGACQGAVGTASFRGLTCLGSNTGGALTTATNSTLIGGGTSKVGNATFASGSGVVLIGSGNVTVDTPLSSTSNYLNIENIISTTGTDTASTSVSTVAGLLSVAATTDSTSTTTGALQVAGGAAIRKRVWMDGLSTSGSGTTYVCVTSAFELINDNAACIISSARFKTDIAAWAGDAGKTVALLEPATFRYKPEFAPIGDGGQKHTGLIAENVAEVAPECVIRDGAGQVKSWDQPCLIALLVAAVQRQQREIEALHAR